MRNIIKTCFLGFSLSTLLFFLPHAEAQACGFNSSERLVFARSSGGAVWGTQDFGYTDDSDFNVAVVHAGLLQPGAKARIRIEYQGSKQHYPGSQANGVESMSWESEFCAVKLHVLETVTDLSEQEALAYEVAAAAGAETGEGECAPAGSEEELLVVADAGEGTVWGNAKDGYTTDSDLGRAAMHAGLLQAGMQARIKITTLGMRTSYQGRQAHGVQSESWGAWCGMQLSLAGKLSPVGSN